MGEPSSTPAEPAKPATPAALPKAGSGNGDVGQPCAACARNKRTLCIRSKKAGTRFQQWGHANLALVEVTPDGQQLPTKTFGNWPSFDNPDPKASTTIMKDYAGDEDHKQYPYVRCKEIDDKGYAKLMQHVNKPNQSWNFYNNNCTTWAGSTWKDVTGEDLYYGQGNPLFYDAPATLGNSILGANGGAPSNFPGSF